MRTNRVYDIVLGRSEAALDGYFTAHKAKDNVSIVVMDLSKTYSAIVEKHFPHILLVTDRFHVIRLVNHHFLKVWADIDPKGRKNRGLQKL